MGGRFTDSDPRSSRRSEKAKGAGFTFIELVFVTLAIGVLIVSALPNFRRGWSSLQTERVAFDLAQLLRTARTLAITQGQQVTWVWEPDPREVWLGTPRPGAKGSTERLPGRFGRVHAIPQTVSLVVTRDDGGVETQVSFFPNGTSQPVTLLIGDDVVPRYEVAVDETTGQVVVSPAGLSAG
jgi:type II secretory pathway pseudopilin PulG